MPNEKKIILSVIILLCAGFSFLFYSEQKQINSTLNGWWAVYFENPKNQDLTFTIENNGKTNNFHWKEMLENNIIQENNIKISAKEKKTVLLPEINNLSGKIIIEISDEAGNEKEVYKILN